MDYVNTLNTENVETPTRYDIASVSNDSFLTLASNNTKTISHFISEVKDACSDFIADVYDLIGDTLEDCDSEYSEDSDYSECSDSDYYSDDDSDCYSDDDKSELTRKIVANEFESSIHDIRNKLDILEKRYITAKDEFHGLMVKEIEVFLTSPTSTT